MNGLTVKLIKGVQLEEINWQFHVPEANKFQKNFYTKNNRNCYLFSLEAIKSFVLNKTQLTCV